MIAPSGLTQRQVGDVGSLTILVIVSLGQFRHGDQLLSVRPEQVVVELPEILRLGVVHEVLHRNANLFRGDDEAAAVMVNSMDSTFVVRALVHDLLAVDRLYLHLVPSLWIGMVRSHREASIDYNGRNPLRRLSVVQLRLALDLDDRPLE